MILGPIHRPEIIDQQVEDAQNHHQDHRTPLGLEPDDHHDTRHKAKQTHNHPAHAPVSRKHESDEQEDQEHAPCKLEIHFAVFFIELRQSGRSKLFANPRVAQDHQ